MIKETKIKLSTDDMIELIAKEFKCNKADIEFEFNTKSVGNGYLDGVKLIKNIRVFDGAVINVVESC